MPEIPSKMHMYHMVKIDSTFFEIIGGGEALIKVPSGTLAV